MSKASVCSTDSLSSSSERSAIALMSPGNCCWICETPLPQYPLAAGVEQAGTDLFFLVYSDSCGAIVAAELAGVTCATVQLLDSTSAFARWLDASRRNIIVLSNKTYEWARRGGRLRLCVFPGTDCEDVE